MAPSPLLVFGRFLRVGDFEIIRDVGSDAALYLRFQRMAIKLLLPMSLVCIFVLAPLHARAGEPSGAADGWTLHATTAHNLPPHSEALLQSLPPVQDAVQYVADTGRRKQLRYDDVKSYWRALLIEYTTLLGWRVEKHPDTRQVEASQHKVVDRL